MPEKTDNLALALMLNEALDKVILSTMDKLITKIRNMGSRNASNPIVFKTFIQPDPLITFEKDMETFAEIFTTIWEKLSSIDIQGKNTATDDFVESLDVTSYLDTIQAVIDPLDKLYHVIPHFRNSENRLVYARGIERMKTALKKGATVPTVWGYIAEVMGHSLIAYKSALEGMAKLQVPWFGPANEERLQI